MHKNCPNPLPAGCDSWALKKRLVFSYTYAWTAGQVFTCGVLSTASYCHTAYDYYGFVDEWITQGAYVQKFNTDEVDIEQRKNSRQVRWIKPNLMIASRFTRIRYRIAQLKVPVQWGLSKIRSFKEVMMGCASQPASSPKLLLQQSICARVHFHGPHSHLYIDIYHQNWGSCKLPCQLSTGTAS